VRALDVGVNLSGHAKRRGAAKRVTANAEILWKLAEHLALTGAPGIAMALFLARRGVRSVPLILVAALAASGTAAFLAFWAYYASPGIGAVWAFLVLFGSVQVAALSWYRGQLDAQLLRELRTPLLLWICGSTFVVYLGFLHGGSDPAIPMSALRFTGQLPTDNDIPQFFAGWFFEHGSHGTPPLYPGEWHMSDRPPLQIGYVLSQRIFAWDASTLHYQVLCVVVQQLWIVGMWAVLCAARLRPKTRSLAIVAAMVSDVAIVHGFFVWPKLIAATFLLAAAALVISPEWVRWRRDLRVAGLFACLCALAMLSHGSSAFALVPLLVLGALRGMPSWRWLGIAGAVGVVFLGSWAAYQRYDDPLGDRLLKWQLGGVVEVDDRGPAEAIVDSYREVGLDGAIEAKWDSFAEMFGLENGPGHFDDSIDALGDARFGDAAAAFRGPRFYSLLPLLGVFLIAPFAMLLARDRGRRQIAEWRFALFCFAFVLVGCLAWGLLLFGSPNAIAYLHVGSLAIPLLGICGCVAGLRATYPRLALAVVAFNILAVLAAYTPSLTPPPGTSYSLLAAVLAAAGLAGFALVAFRASSEPREPAATPLPDLAGRVGVGQG
jgi:hypothetical protein